MNQKIIWDYEEIGRWIEDRGIKKCFLVCGKSMYSLPLNDYFESLEGMIDIIRFSDFQANPIYESVVKGVNLFRTEECDAIVAVGGGSAIDVAKCIKLFSNLPDDGGDGNWLNADIISNDIPFLVVPTTAGTGSEVTRFAVIYYNGTKQSITAESIVPDVVLFDSSALQSLPIYQKKAAMCDALCHAIESFWSINSNGESKELSKKAIELIVANSAAYLDNDAKACEQMLVAANIAGKAINITQTTAGHAMCYKITGLFGCAHGHAAILCDRVLYPWMLDNLDKCIDSRGKDYLKQTLDDIGRALGGHNAETGVEILSGFFSTLKLDVPTSDGMQFQKLVKSVNPDRLRNHPIELSEEIIDMLYHKILNGAE